MQLDTIGCLSNPLYHNGLLCTLCGQRGSGRGGGAGVGLVLLIGLFCLILFGARLYCDNYRDRIACRLIEGHSLLSCIRTHLVLTVLYYGAVAAGLLLLKLAIELDYNILLGTFLAELLITLLACGSIARKNLYQIVKGAEA